MRVPSPSVEYCQGHGHINERKMSSHIFGPCTCLSVRARACADVKLVGC